MKRGKVFLGFLTAAILAAVVISFLPAQATALSTKADPPARAGVVFCSDYAGTPCDVPGTKFRCYHLYPSEPGICRCSATTGLWGCG